MNFLHIFTASLFTLISIYNAASAQEIIDPEKLTDNPHKPPVMLTDFLVDGKSVSAGEFSVMNIFLITLRPRRKL